MSQQKNLYSRQEMQKSMHRDREDYEEKKCGEILGSKKIQARALAKKGHSVSLISKILHLNYNTVLRHLIDK
ncbi:hypothetical protein ES705_15663 [subsurface metagenome]